MLAFGNVGRRKTSGAARSARHCFQDPAVTITEKAPDFAALEPYVEKVLQLLLKEKEMHLVNVNVPEKPKGIRWTRQAVKQYDGKVIPGNDPMKRPIYWFTIKPLVGEEEGTDRWAFGKSFVSITPLRLDLTDEKDLARVLALPQTSTKSTQPQNENQKIEERCSDLFARQL